MAVSATGTPHLHLRLTGLVDQGNTLFSSHPLPLCLGFIVWTPDCQQRSEGCGQGLASNFGSLVSGMAGAFCLPLSPITDPPGKDLVHSWSATDVR